MRADNSAAVYAFLKPAHDAHTLGIQSAASLLQDCGYTVIRAGDRQELALSYINADRAKEDIVDWIRRNKLNNGRAR